MRASNFRQVHWAHAPFAGVIVAEFEVEAVVAAVELPPVFDLVVPQPLEATPTIRRLRRQEDFKNWIMRLFWFRVEFVKGRSLAATWTVIASLCFERIDAAIAPHRRVYPTMGPRCPSVPKRFHGHGRISELSDTWRSAGGAIPQKRWRTTALLRHHHSSRTTLFIWRVRPPSTAFPISIQCGAGNLEMRSTARWTETELPNVRLTHHLIR